ncbi:hypothetical protein G7Y89_g1631 [Cudoniella acicularis]|uniref:Uncharacterized protein n=1 Tax=Cudoniella acicularis TaxID=354080 RepID=A0A8H4W779_9HELO|nr:hypothetical protein G7Y89_g1631 [Cudoniella acicularis]
MITRRADIDVDCLLAGFLFPANFGTPRKNPSIGYTRLRQTLPTSVYNRANGPRQAGLDPRQLTLYKEDASLERLMFFPELTAKYGLSALYALKTQLSLPPTLIREDRIYHSKAKSIITAIAEADVDLFDSRRVMNKKLRYPIPRLEDLDVRRARYETTTPLSDYTLERHFLLA